MVFHAERVAKLLMAEHPGLNVIVKTSPDAASQANAVQDLDTQGIDALVILPSDPDPLVNAIKEVKGKGKFVALVDRAPSNNDNSVRDLYVAKQQPSSRRSRQASTSRTPRRMPKWSSSAVCRSRSTSSARTALTRALLSSNVKVLDRQYGNWNRDDAFKVMQDYLTKYQKIDVVWCQDDDMAVGVLQAIEQAKRTDIKYVVAGA